jgi:hypothetical protein
MASVGRVGVIVTRIEGMIACQPLCALAQSHESQWASERLCSRVGMERALNDDEDQVQPYDELEGAFVTLKLLEPSAELAADFAKWPGMALAIGITERKPTFEYLTVLIEDQTLFVWSIERHGKQVGYWFLVLYDGPPYASFWSTRDRALPDELVKDCFEVLVPVYFQNLDEEALFFYLPQPVKHEVHEQLTESGFDLFEDNPTIDNSKVACYVLERHTFEAYYGEGGDDEEFEEDDFSY